MAFQPKKDKFMALLLEIAKNIKESADYFADYKLKNVSDLKIFSEKMKEFEHKGDSYGSHHDKRIEQCFHYTY